MRKTCFNSFLRYWQCRSCLRTPGLGSHLCGHSGQIQAHSCGKYHRLGLQAIPKGLLRFCWGSPPCTHFSIARTTGGPRDIEGATALVQRTLEIFHYFCCPWAMENLATGLLKNQAVVQGPSITQPIANTMSFHTRKHQEYGTL